MTSKRSRRRGRGSLQSYKTKSGTKWRFQIWVPIDPESPELGEKKYSRAGFDTQAEADEKMQEALLKRKNDERFHGQIPTLEKYGKEWLDSLKLQASTLTGYRRQFNNYIVPHLGARPLDRITAPTIGNLYKKLKARGGKDGNPLSANTVNKTSVTLASILDAAVADGFISRNPARIKQIVKAPTGRDIRDEKPEIQTWTAEQLKSFLSWSKNEYEDDHYPLWLTLANTGMRRGEAIALQWRDVDFKNSRIAIRRAADSTGSGETKPPKSSRPRVVDIDGELLAVLRETKALRGSLSLDLARANSFIFGHDDGRMRAPVQITNRWKRRTLMAQKTIQDLPHIPLHGLRHTHATLLLELGESPKIVQERLGHRSITITLDIYSHVTPTMQRNAVDRFAALFQ